MILLKQKIALTALLAVLSACVSPASSQPAARLYPSQEDRPRDSFIARGKENMVVTAHPLASQAGFAMLEQGGNAVDAAVAASFAISVVRPQSTGIGGGGFLLYYDHKNAGSIKAFDFRERAPGAATQNMYITGDGAIKNFTYKGKTLPHASLNGHLAVGTPGLVAGLVEVHKKHGSLPLKDVLAPAITLANKGFPTYPELARAIKSREEILTAFEGTREIFFPNGKPLQAGEVLVQKDLAWTLQQIAERGAEGFYKGEVAKRIAKEMKEGRGILSEKDLASYEVKERAPVSGSYRGYKVVSMPPPSSGGVHVVQMLNILENFKVGESLKGSAQEVQLLTETMRRAYADRAKYLGDPDFVEVPVQGLVSQKYADELAKGISLAKAASSKDIGAGNPTPYESPSTTHLSVVDKWGNAVSSTQTINYTFGSGVVARGTGVVLNDEMDDFAIAPNTPNAFGLVGGQANAVQARKTMLSSMTPTLVFDDKGKLNWVLGSPGGSRIITATLQTIVNLVDHKMPLEDAVHAYRMHHQWLPDVVYVEPDSLTEQVQKELQEKGYNLSYDQRSIGDVQAIGRTNEGWVGVSDTRSTGKPVGK